MSNAKYKTTMSQDFQAQAVSKVKFLASSFTFSRFSMDPQLKKTRFDKLQIFPYTQVLGSRCTYLSDRVLHRVFCALTASPIQPVETNCKIHETTI